MSTTKASLHLRIQVLEGELAEYRCAVQSLLATKIELASAVDAQPSREALIIQAATLREAIFWLANRDYALTDQQRRHVLLLAEPTS